MRFIAKSSGFLAICGLRRMIGRICGVLANLEASVRSGDEDEAELRLREDLLRIYFSLISALKVTIWLFLDIFFKFKQANSDSVSNEVRV